MDQSGTNGGRASELAGPVESRTSAATRSPTASPKVLIVDDESDTVDVVQKMLEGRGFDIYRAFDGDAALDAAHRFKPDVVLLDVMMPKQDGWLVCAKLKSIRPAPKVIIFTVLKHGESDRMAQFVHSDGIIHKPFTREQLLEKLSLATGRDQSSCGCK